MKHPRHSGGECLADFFRAVTVRMDGIRQGRYVAPQLAPRHEADAAIETKVHDTIKNMKNIRPLWPKIFPIS